MDDLRYGFNSDFFVKLNMKWEERIVSDKNILLGKPVIKGTRLSVEHILDRFAIGWSEEMILESYSFISKVDILAVFAYLNNLEKNGLIYRGQ